MNSSALAKGATTTFMVLYPNVRISDFKTVKMYLP